MEANPVDWWTKQYPWSWKQLYPILFPIQSSYKCFSHCFYDTLCSSLSTLFTSKICKEFSFRIGKAWLLLYDGSLLSILREHKHIKYLYIPPIYRKITLGTWKQTLYRWRGCERNALSVLAQNGRCLPSTVSPLITGSSAERTLVCQDSKRSCLLRSNKALTDSGICRAATKHIKPMLPPPHTLRMVYRNGSSHLHVWMEAGVLLEQSSCAEPHWLQGKWRQQNPKV